MKQPSARLTTAATLILMCATTAIGWGHDTRSEPELVMIEFLHAFVAYDYETCESLLAPGATITITRRYQGGQYQSVHQDAREWLDQVRGTGVKGIEDFAVELHETAGLEHGHGATAVVRFTSTGLTNRGVFVNRGFDTGSLLETPDGWRILHYSSFEDFSWGASGQPGQDD